MLELARTVLGVRPGGWLMGADVLAPPALDAPTGFVLANVWGAVLVVGVHAFCLLVAPEPMARWARARAQPVGPGLSPSIHVLGRIAHACLLFDTVPLLWVRLVPAPLVSPGIFF